jgi:hypothetical protein
MDYVILFKDTLSKLGIDLVGVWNTFDPPYQKETGWPLKLPRVDFLPNTRVLLHFQDFVTIKHNRVLELEQVEQHYGEHADQVIVTYWNHGLDKIYNGPVHLVEFSNHNYDLALALKRTQDQWVHQMNSPRTIPWQCLNGRVCRHRRRVADTLSQQFFPGVLSLGDEIKLSQWDYTTYRGTENIDNFLRLQNIYSSCAVNIVTETEYDTSPGIITEKTLMAFAAGQIPIVIGHQGIVGHCRELGFDMFDDVVDNSYDQLLNDVRAEQAIHRNRDLILGQIDLGQYQQRLQQQRTFLLEKFPAVMQEKFIRQCRALLGISHTSMQQGTDLDYRTVDM